jgi:hypothetical protein
MKLAKELYLKVDEAIQPAINMIWDNPRHVAIADKISKDFTRAPREVETLVKIELRKE